MTEYTITGLPAEFSELASDDYLVGDDTSETVDANVMKKLPLSVLLAWLNDEIDLQPDMVVVGRSASQSIPHHSVTTLKWTVNNLADPVTMHSTTSDTDKLYARKTGWYEAKLNATFALSNGGEFRWVAIRDSDGNELALEDRDATGNTSRYFSVSCEIYLEEDDFIYADCYQDSGGALNITRTSDQHPSFSLKFIREN
jgi:hypothetical protein